MLYNIALGLLAGFLAKMVLPGDKFEPKGCITTALLGMAGGWLGGWLLEILNISTKGSIVMGLVGAFVGAVILIVLGRFIFGGSGTNNDRTPAA